MKIISSIKIIAQSGMALRGHSKSEGSFEKLLELRSEDDALLSEWLKSKVNLTSLTICNEIGSLFWAMKLFVKLSQKSISSQKYLVLLLMVLEE